MTGRLLSVAEAQSRLLSLAEPIETETSSLAQALGRWAARDIASLRTQPSADLSAMDGYAIRFADMPGPWRVVGQSAAGSGFPGSIAEGEAVRIFAGAPLPSGADTVLIQEEAACEAEALTLSGEGPGQIGHNVRPRGLDFAEHDIVVRAGERLTPARLALAGAAGHGALPVRRRVRVAVAATGDELVPPGSPTGNAQLPETNRLMLTAQLADLPVDLIDLGILPDRQDALEAAFRSVDTDLLVTSGGASVGDHDLVRPALEAAGARIDFWRVALRPGKPLMAGRLGNAIVLGLPGNPVSAFVTTMLFVRPLIAHLAGAADPLPRARSIRLTAGLPANGPRQDYLRATIGPRGVEPAPAQDSAMLGILARSDCLIVRRPHAPPAQIGDSAEILDLA